MRCNRKVMESMTVATALLVMSAFTTVPEEAKTTAAEPVIEVTTTNQNGTAGIVDVLQKVNVNAMQESGMMVANIERSVNGIVALGVEGVDTGETQENTDELLDEEVAEESTKELAEEDTQETESTSEEEVSEESDGDSEEANKQAKEEENKEGEQIPEDVVDEENTEDEEDELKDENVKTQETQKTEKTEDSKKNTETKKEQKESKKNEKKKEKQKDVVLVKDGKVPYQKKAWSDKVMANVEEDMNIRSSADENSEVVGKFYRGDVADVIGSEGDWTQITSGNVTGYVRNDYLVYEKDAYELANEVCTIYAVVKADSLRIRGEASEDAGIVTMAENGEKLRVAKDAEQIDGWVAVETADATAYVSADYVDVSLNLGTALNSEEVAAKEAEEARIAAEKEAAAKGETRKAAVAASTDDVTLLGALIQCEAGSCSYEGMVAVGAVVMNRVRSGAYPGSISGVIYQGGQFTPALNGSVAAVLSRGVSGACIQAAQEAIGGRDNTNGALSFRSAASGYSGTVIGANVFF